MSVLGRQNRERVWLGLGLVLIVSSVVLRVWREPAPGRCAAEQRCSPYVSPQKRTENPQL